MKTFEERKEHCLWKMQELDKSKKGSVDASVREILNTINSLDDYYSTSSCGGRIVLLNEPESGKKNDYEWLYVSHDQTSFQELKKSLKIPKKGIVWFRMQTVILHVACKNLEAANKLLKLFYAHGWKRSGIFSTENDVMLELLSVESMDSLIAKEGELLVNDEYLQKALEVANDKLAVAHEKIQLAQERIQAEFH